MTGLEQGPKAGPTAGRRTRPSPDAIDAHLDDERGQDDDGDDVPAGARVPA